MYIKLRPIVNSFLVDSLVGKAWIIIELTWSFRHALLLTQTKLLGRLELT